MPYDIVQELRAIADTTPHGYVLYIAAYEIEDLRLELEHERRVLQQVHDELADVERLLVQYLHDELADVEEAADE